MPNTRPTVWLTRQWTSLQLTPNAGGVLDTWTVPEAGTVIRVLMQCHFDQQVAATGGTVARPAYLIFELEGGVGNPGARRLQRSLVRPNYTLSTYVPTGSQNTYWYLLGNVGSQDVFWDFSPQLGGQGVSNVQMRMTIAAALEAGTQGQTANFLGQVQLRYLVMT